MNSSEAVKNTLNLKGLLFTKYLWGGYFLILIGLGAVLAASAWYGQHQLKVSASAQTHSIAVALDELNRRQVQTMAVPLEYMSFQVQQREGVDQFSPEELTRFFKFIRTVLPSTGIRDLFAVDKKGNVYSSSPTAPKLRRGNYGASPEFVYVKTQKNSTVLSSAVSLVDGRNVLVLMKSLHTRRGRFAGIVGVTRTFDDFENFYQSSDFHFPINFAMLRDDGKVLYHYPAEASNFAASLRLPKDLEGESEGVVNLHSANSAQSIGGYYKFASSYGSTIFVGYDDKVVFANWRKVLKLGMVTYVVLMGFLAVLVGVAHRRQKSVERVVEEHRRRDQLIRQIQRPTEVLTGTAFLQELVVRLCEAFGAENALIGVLLPEHTDAVKCVVHRIHGEFVPEQIYNLRGTPFESLKPADFFAHSKSTSLIYPEDTVLGHRGIQSSMGLILQNLQQQPIGILMVYSEHEMRELNLKRAILSAFASRVGAELERVHTDELRKEVDVLRKQIEERSLQSQKMEAIGNLAEGLAHDFNNLLAVMLASTEKLLNMHKDSLQDVHYLESVKKACHRARHLVSQILAYSPKEEPGGYPVSMKSLFAETSEFLQSMLPSNIKVNVDLGECCGLEIRAELSQLQQALMNLCMNASRSLEGGGGEIRVSLQKNRIKDRLYIKCIFHHSGDEVGREEIEKMFNPFYAENVGMVVAQRIITNHQGFIEVKSEVGQGTDYEIFLPVIEAEVSAEVRSIVSLKTEKRVLIVDDEPEIGLLIKELLEIEGLQVDAETDPVNALAHFTADPSKYFVIISDLAMPEMSGFEFCRHVRNIHPWIPLILWSGYYQYLDEELQDQNVKVLSKPVDVKKLLQMINAEVSQQSLQDTARAVGDPGSGLLART